MPSKDPINITKYKKNKCNRYKILDQDGCMIWDLSAKHFIELQKAIVKQIEKEYPVLRRQWESDKRVV